MALGVTVETGPAFLLAPLVQVAWAEGAVTDGERATVLRLAKERGIEPTSPAYAQLDAWLSQRPVDALFDAAIEAIKSGLSVLTPEERADRIRRSSTRVARSPMRRVDSRAWSAWAASPTRRKRCSTGWPPGSGPADGVPDGTVIPFVSRSGPSSAWHRRNPWVTARSLPYPRSVVILNWPARFSRPDPPPSVTPRTPHLAPRPPADPEARVPGLTAPTSRRPCWPRQWRAIVHRSRRDRAARS